MQLETISVFLLAAALSAAHGFGAPKTEAPSLENLPLVFEPNRGQADPSVLWTTRGPNYVLYLTEGGMVLHAQQPHGIASIRMKLEHGRPWNGVGLEPTGGVSNYFSGAMPAEWRAGIPHFRKVLLRDVYSGIDLVLYGNPRQLEYDLVVRPEADPAQICLVYEGAVDLRLTRDGDLILTSTDGAEFRQKRPAVHQEFPGRRVEVAGSYKLDQGGRVTLVLGPYDKSRSLIVDPVIIYSTYLGGSGTDVARAVAVDSQGAVYVAGATSSTDLPTHGPFQPKRKGSTDVFVAKVNPSGDALAYLTYLGGSASQEARGIALDKDGNAYVAGWTRSRDFPTLNAFQKARAGTSDTDYAQDAFVFKLSPAGDQLLYSTYLGGSRNDIATSITVDAAGNAYLCGVTYSPDFPLKQPFQSRFAGGDGDAFVAKLDPNGGALGYSTYFGGSWNDSAWAIAVDQNGSAYITGSTTSWKDFPLRSPLQDQNAGGDADGFVARFTPGGDALIFSTFLGGSAGDFLTAIALDQDGSVYLAGWTENYCSTRVYQGARGFPIYFESVVIKLNAAADSVIYRTCLSRRNYDTANSIAVDSTGHAYVAGLSATVDPVRLSSHSDAIITALAPDGKTATYFQYLAGTRDSEANAIAIDREGAVYVVGSTKAADFPTTTPVQSRFQGGDSDAFLSKISVPALILTNPPVLVAPASGSVNQPLSLTLEWAPVDGATSYDVYFGTSTSLPRPSFTGVTRTSQAIGGLAYNTVYYWKIVAKNSAGTVTGPIWSFMTRLAPCIYTLSHGGQGFSSSGGTGAVSVAAADHCTWTVVSNLGWFTVGGGLSRAGNGTVTYTATANTGNARNGTITIAGQAFAVEQASATVLGLAGAMAHLTSGVDWSSIITLVNSGTNSSSARLDFFNSTGSLLSLPLTFPQNPLSTGPLLAATLDRTLRPSASVILASQGPDQGDLLQGWGRLSGGAGIGGFAIFRVKGSGQEAAVPLETRNAGSYILSFDNTGGVATGLAVANVSSATASIPAVVRDDGGTSLGTYTITLSPQGHDSFMLTDRYSVTAAKRGTIRLDTPVGGRISVLGLRAAPAASGGFTITTIPALANVTSSGGSLAHVAAGGGWQTVFVLTNTGVTPARAQLSLFDESGGPLALPLRYTQSGGPAMASSVDQFLAPGAELIVTAEDSAIEVSVGSARLTTNGAVGGFAFFRFNPSGQEAVVPLEIRTSGSFMLPFDNTAGVATGVAVANVVTSAATIPVVIRDDTGANLASGAITLAAQGHTSFMLSDRFAATAGVRGTVEFTTPAGGQISLVGLRTAPTTNGSYAMTTIPVFVK